jgi:hypothetical protein
MRGTLHFHIPPLRLQSGMPQTTSKIGLPVNNPRYGEACAFGNHIASPKHLSIFHANRYLNSGKTSAL